MKRLAWFVIVAIVVATAGPSYADVIVERTGSENPVQEIAKSVLWGSVAGLVLGSALTLATENADNDAAMIRYGFAGGALLGLGVGIMHVSSRPSAAMLEFEDGHLHLASASFIQVRPAPIPSLRGEEPGSVVANVVRVSF
jgi:hypothetical protein